MLDHTALLQKMKCNGFKESVIKRFQSYLSNRNFSATIDVFSDTGLINFGVQQGSILLHVLLNETGLKLYADNTCIFYQDKDVERIQKVLNKEYLSLCGWFIDNKLSIHIGNDKTKTISSSWKKIPPKLSISCGDYSLQQCNTVEYIQCYIDSNLTGEPMARRVLKRLTQN